MAKKVTAQYLYSGLPDYWCGDGDRWDTNKGCVFAYYGRTTTLRELIDSAVEDYRSGGDTDEKDAFEDIDGEDVRKALIDSLTDAGRQDYDTNIVCEFSQEYARVNPDTTDDDDDGNSPYVVWLLTVESD